MRLVSFEGGYGRVEGDSVIPMGSAIVDFLNGVMPCDREPVPLSALRLRAPIPSPAKIIAVGLNYRDHAAETSTPVPSEPALFAKFSNSLIAEGETIEVPAVTEQPDYEAELGVIIGRTARRVSSEDALAYVAGYTCLNDVSARDIQARNLQWMRGKAIDTFLPAGPWMVTADEIPDPQVLAIRCIINDEVVQDSNTDQMIWGVADLISFISQTMTLSPGDLIATGTPHGVGLARTPPRFLLDGDRVTVEIEGVGSITNPVARR